ncbi:hypothetical protein QTN47_00015 [Danxiaibacter flavus]|uniref:Uncharacterized protein n=1 Tax=Danxiaibacter flavus TaxID=3049108 RepID=A0ABV3Z7L4_9BACT|nr:hypothetical protein QNM32_00015 [Chitinophagaceae bacterium DXS]
MKRLLKMILLILGLNSNTLHAQVGMMTNSPSKSAALDLSKSNKGLLIPKISLQNTSDVSAINGNNPASFLLVYNTNETITGAGAAGVGFYYWESGLWKKLITYSNVNDSTWHLQGNTGTNTQNFLGASNGSDLVVKTNNTEKFRIASDGKVGIGTGTPQYNLEVTGDTRITSDFYLGTTARAPQSGTAQLVRDNVTGQVFTVAASSGSSKAYNYVKYTVRNVKQDLLSDFDTKISSTDYTVMIVGSSFAASQGMKMLPSYNGTFAYQSLYAQSSGGTWHLKADYVGGTTFDNSNGNWDIYCLVINNALVVDLPDQVLDMQGNTTGSFTSAPGGL